MCKLFICLYLDITCLNKKEYRFDTKQPPYRILFQREVNTVCLQIAVAETEQAIRSAWIWIEKNMIPELETIEHPVDKEYWVADKIDMIVTAIGKWIIFLKKVYHKKLTDFIRLRHR